MRVTGRPIATVDARHNHVLKLYPRGSDNYRAFRVSFCGVEFFFSLVRVFFFAGITGRFGFVGDARAWVESLRVRGVAGLNDTPSLHLHCQHLTNIAS
jgi:hypothetical protein